MNIHSSICQIILKLETMPISSRMDNSVVVYSYGGILESNEDEPFTAHTSTWMHLTNTTLREGSKSQRNKVCFHLRKDQKQAKLNNKVKTIKKSNRLMMAKVRIVVCSAPGGTSEGGVIKQFQRCWRLSIPQPGWCFHGVLCVVIP